MMDTQHLMATGKELGLKEEDLRMFVKSEQDAAREERAAVRAAESAAAIRDAESAAAIRDAESAAAIREHDIHMLQLQIEADRIRIHEANITREHLDSTRTSRNPARSPKLPPFNDTKDDMDAHIQRFERYAQNEGWDSDCLGVYLGSLLTGQALEEYSRLPAEEARNYATLKKALLTRYQLTQEDYRRKFMTGSQLGRESASQFLVRLEHLFDHWVRMSDIQQTYEGLRQLTIMEQYLHVCPRELALFIRDRSPTGLKQLVELADIYTSARASVSPAPRINSTPRNPMSQAPPRFETPQNAPSTRPPYEWTCQVDNIRGRCFLCNMPGHRAASCPTGRPHRLHFDGTTKPVSGNAAMSYSTDHGSSSHTGQTYLQCGGVLPIIGSVCCHQLDRLPFMKGRVEETDVQVLRDTGCNGVIVKCDLVPHRCFTGSRQRIILMDRSVIEVPVAKVRVDTPVFCGEVYALCVQNPVCEVIIGNIPGVHPNILGTTTNEEMLCTASNDKARLPMDKRTACAVHITGQCERAERPMKPIMTSDGCRALQMVIQAKHAECCHLRECSDVIKSQAGADIRQLRQQIAATEERYKSEVAHVGACLAQKDQLAIDLKVTLKQLTEENEISKPLAHVFNMSLQEGIVPLEWKEANIIPLFKKGSRNKSVHYRPVSLTSVICKLLETIIRDHMIDFLVKHKLINPSQHGFLKARSCLTNLLCFLRK